MSAVVAGGSAGYNGQGNHQLAVADVDNDGKDEIVFGAMTLDNNGTVLYSTNLGHGDALHVGDLDPERGGLEVFKVMESASSPYGIESWDAATGVILSTIQPAAASRVLPRHRNAGTAEAGYLFSAKVVPRR